jgi:hypothetical protein
MMETKETTMVAVQFVHTREGVEMASYSQIEESNASHIHTILRCRTDVPNSASSKLNTAVMELSIEENSVMPEVI